MEELVEELLIFDKEEIALDIETTGLNAENDEIKLIQIKDKVNNSLIIDVFKTLNTINKKEEFWYIITCFLSSVGSILGHNLKFDFSFLYKVGFRCPVEVIIWDTFIVEQVIQGKKAILKDKNDKEANMLEGYSLKALVKKYLNLELDKQEQKSDWSFKGNLTQQQVNYASKDVEYLHQIKNMQTDILTGSTLMRIARMENYLLKVIINMQFNGIRIDVNNLDLLIAAFESDVIEFKNQLLDSIDTKRIELDTRNDEHIVDFFKNVRNI